MSFKPYPKYKDSGVEWLGRVPEHWTLPRIKTISRVSGGGTPSCGGPLLPDCGESSHRNGRGVFGFELIG